MKTKFAAIAAGAVALVALTGCEDVQYDNSVAECQVSNNGYYLEITLERDTDASGGDLTPEFFGKLCDDAAAGFKAEFQDTVDVQR